MSQMTHQTSAPHFLPAATHSYLERAAESLREAITSTERARALRPCPRLGAAGDRRAAGGPGPARTPAAAPSRQKNAWVLLAEVAPELGEWAAFFAAGADKRAAAEAGSRRAVTEREADDLVRDADRFLALVETSLGLTEHLPFRVA